MVPGYWLKNVFFSLLRTLIARVVSHWIQSYIWVLITDVFWALTSSRHYVSTLYSLSHLILKIILWGRVSYYFPMADPVEWLLKSNLHPLPLSWLKCWFENEGTAAILQPWGNRHEDRGLHAKDVKAERQSEPGARQHSLIASLALGWTNPGLFISEK